MYTEELFHKKNFFFYKKNLQKLQKKLIKLFIFLIFFIIINLTIFLLFYLSDENIVKNNLIDLKKLFEILGITENKLKKINFKLKTLNRSLIDIYNKQISNFNFEAYIFFFNSNLLILIFFFIIIILTFQKQKNIFAIFIKIISFLLIIIFLFFLLFLTILGIVIFYFDNISKLFLIFVFKNKEIKKAITNNNLKISINFNKYFFETLENYLKSNKYINTIIKSINSVIKNKIYITFLSYIHAFFNVIKKINILSKSILKSNLLFVKEIIVYLTYSLFMFNKLLIWIFLYKYNKVTKKFKKYKNNNHENLIQNYF